jgi:hypothetical protein
MPFSLRSAKAANKKAMRRYTALGERIFLDALKKQAVENPDPKYMVDAYVQFYQAVFVDAAKRGYYQVREMEKTKDFLLDDFFLSTWKEWIKVWVLENLGTRIQGVNETTRRIIQESLSESISQGLNTFQIQDELQKIVGSKSRAKAIAITEATTANNMGLERSADDFQAVSGVVMYKLWIHSGNPREPRGSHISAQNNPIRKEEPFNIEGVLLKSPGNAIEGQDRKRVARQVINCGCAVSYVSERFAKRRFPDSF